MPPRFSALVSRAVRQASVCGHFGEFLQGRLGPGGAIVLITLPCPVLRAHAVWQPGRGFGFWQGARPVLRLADLRALFARALGTAPFGRARLSCTMPPGGGAGASTAARLALLRCLRPNLQNEAGLCLSLEGATDPLMIEAPERTLWAPRAARAVASLPPLPAFDVLGGFAGPGQRTDPSDSRFADISDLVIRWKTGPDRAALADLATESARRNHALRGGADPAPVLALGRRMGALGLASAHTGAAQALLFAPGTIPPEARAAMQDAGLSHITRFRIGDPR
ncbi:threonine kinase [Rhodovulum imhoffii]|uniref:Threonine kinase n=1 Tax=Rhodovulum imhoffii TaxID=365340 RepID=A0A2T5BVI4_9RHOB|nr:propanediol utilization protein [Rhodovulum imhoffii]MBK5934193.1 hypothetical protein [Rhodovulum imhoffii]PTN03560.1 threonine kinase [Rhodovulum imhoffii]